MEGSEKVTITRADVGTVPFKVTGQGTVSPPSEEYTSAYRELVVARQDVAEAKERVAAAEARLATVRAAEDAKRLVARMTPAQKAELAKALQEPANT